MEEEKELFGICFVKGLWVMFVTALSSMRALSPCSKDLPEVPSSNITTLGVSIQLRILGEAKTLKLYHKVSINKVTKPESHKYLVIR